MRGYSVFICLLATFYTCVLCVPMSQTNVTTFLDINLVRGIHPRSTRFLDYAVSTTGNISYGSRTNLFSCKKLHIPSTATSVYLKPLKMIMQSNWVPRLQDVLAKMKFQNRSKDALVLDSQKQGLNPRKQVTVVFGDIKYALSLLNWLVSALVVTSPPIENIIIISIDEQLQELLDKKHITSVYVNPETVTCGQVRQKLSRIWIARCALYKLLNHWGYDVMAYDTDAIVFKNIQHILDEYPSSDIIGSSGVYPFSLGAKWGQTLCMGVVLFRSTRKTETLWTVISRAKKKSLLFDDQVNINNAFNNCNISWMNNTDNDVVTGECVDDKLQGLRVTILPASIICRKCHTKDKDSLYVWHKQSKKSGEIKMKTAVSTHTWHLKNITLRLTEETKSIIDDGENDKLKGIHWIKAISK